MGKKRILLAILKLSRRLVDVFELIRTDALENEVIFYLFSRKKVRRISH